jgi:exodeoxyribonuclease-3
MRLISWNVNGIRAVSKKGFSEWFAAESPDILCLQETKAHPEQLDETLLHPAGYHSYWSSAEKKGYSGVVTYTKQEPLSVQYGFGIPRFDSEGRIVITEFKEFTLLNIYFPNGKKDDIRLQYKMDFYAATLDHCTKLRKAGKKVIICGDVNTAHKEIDLARPKENSDTSGFLPIERAWIDEFLAAGYIDTLRQITDQPELYSWWDYKTGARERNTGWRIDYFYISEDLKQKLKDAFILTKVYGSDHCPVGIELL